MFVGKMCVPKMSVAKVLMVKGPKIRQILSPHTSSSLDLWIPYGYLASPAPLTISEESPGACCIRFQETGPDENEPGG